MGCRMNYWPLLGRGAQQPQNARGERERDEIYSSTPHPQLLLQCSLVSCEAPSPVARVLAIARTCEPHWRGCGAGGAGGVRGVGRSQRPRDAHSSPSPRKRGPPAKNLPYVRGKSASAIASAQGSRRVSPPPSLTLSLSHSCERRADRARAGESRRARGVSAPPTQARQRRRQQRRRRLRRRRRRRRRWDQWWGPRRARAQCHFVPGVTVAPKSRAAELGRTFGAPRLQCRPSPVSFSSAVASYGRTHARTHVRTHSRARTRALTRATQARMQAAGSRAQRLSRDAAAR
jgi:hypothetical protein